MTTDQPPLLVLDDYEGQIAAAPAMTDLRTLATVTILDRPLTAADSRSLQASQIILALRERTSLDESFFAACPDLELVLQTGGHAYHIDQAAAARRGIVVALGRRATQPTVAVPELAFALMLGLVRKIHPLTTGMAQGDWAPAMGGTLAGRTLGILGYGRHGRPVRGLPPPLACRSSFGIAPAPTNQQSRPCNGSHSTRCWRAPMWSRFICGCRQSRGLLNRERLAKMKPSAFLINTAHGAIVDEEALIEAFREQRIAGAGLDVFTNEPLSATSPLRTLPNVLLTPHIGWQVSEVLHEFTAIAADQLRQWCQGQLAPTEVLNPEAIQVPRKRSGNIALFLNNH